MCHYHCDGEGISRCLSSAPGDELSCKPVVFSRVVGSCSSDSSST